MIDPADANYTVFQLLSNASDDGSNTSHRRRMATVQPRHCSRHEDFGRLPANGISQKQINQLSFLAPLTMTPLPNLAEMDRTTAGNWVAARWFDWLRAANSNEQ